MGSMGQHDDYLSSNTRAILKKIFTRIPQRVIWKSETPVNDLSSNVYNGQWLPQNEILRMYKNL